MIQKIILFILTLLGLSRRNSPIKKKRPFENILRWEPLARKHQTPNINYMTILAIIANESGGDPNAKGSSGEVGLMQLTYRAFLDAKDHAKLKFSFDDIKDVPENQIESGTAYLDWLYSRLQSLEATIKAYNIGIGNFENGNLTNTAEKYWRRFIDNKRKLYEVLLNE